MRKFKYKVFKLGGEPLDEPSEMQQALRKAAEDIVRKYDIAVSEHSLMLEKWYHEKPRRGIVKWIKWYKAMPRKHIIVSRTTVFGRGTDDHL